MFFDPLKAGGIADGDAVTFGPVRRPGTSTSIHRKLSSR